MSDTPTPAHDTPNETGPTPRDTPTIPGGPVLSLSEAVAATGTSRSTLQRRLKAGEIDGATRTETGGWAIPIVGLIAAGLVPRTTPADPATDYAPGRVAELEAELARVRAALATAEAVAAERAEHVADLRAALEAMARALPAAPAAQRTRWWHRAERPNTGPV